MKNSLCDATAVEAGLHVCKDCKSLLSWERNKSKGFPVSRLDTLSSLGATPSIFLHSVSHASSSASFGSLVAISSTRFHFMNRYAMSHSTAIALSTIAIVQSPPCTSALARPKIAMPTRLPSGGTSQIVELHLGHFASSGNSMPVTCTEKVSPHLQGTGNENFIS